MNKRELQSYLWLRRNIEQLEERLCELESEATRMTTRYSDQPKGGPRKTMEDLVIKMVEVQEQIKKQLNKAYDLIQRVETAIESLPPREQYLIRAHYIDCKTWEQVAVDMHYSWQHVHRIHAQALALLTGR